MPTETQLASVASNYERHRLAGTLDTLGQELGMTRRQIYNAAGLLRAEGKLQTQHVTKAPPSGNGHHRHDSDEAARVSPCS